MRILLAIAAMALVAACGQNQGYPPQIEMNFRNACEARSQINGLCACVWERIEAEVPADELMALERLPIAERETHPLTIQIEGYSVACAEEIQSEVGPGEQTPAP